MKKLFSTPKRAVISTICIMLIIFGIVIAAFFIFTSRFIGKSEAQDIALRDAGLTRKEVSGLHASLDHDDGCFEYEVEFHKDGAEYEYVLEAEDGDIISRDIDGSAPMNNNSQQTAQSAETSQGSETPQSGITLDRAKEIALSDAGFSESDVTFTKQKKDYDDGHDVYEIEFYSGSTEYDYEIDAVTGDVISYDIDKNDHVNNNSQQTTQSGETPQDSETPQSGITLDRAKEIALSDAGFSESDVTFTKQKKDHDDGRDVYEIEFYSGSTEYEYEIDADTGDMISHDIDRR